MHWISDANNLHNYSTVYKNRVIVIFGRKININIEVLCISIVSSIPKLYNCI
jgi:hypothetical protein